MFSDVVMEIPKNDFEAFMDEIKEKQGRQATTPSSTADDMKEVVVRFKAIYKEQKGVDFPQDPEGAADGGRQGRVPFLGQPARHRTTAA